MPPRTYIDNGKTAKSGHLEKRDGLHRLHRDALAGLFDVVVVVDLDRFTRSDRWRERAEVYGPLQDAGVKIAVSGTGQLLDLDTDMGDLMLGVGNFQSSAWLRKHVERITRGKLEAISKGKKPAGPTPFGYLYDRWTGIWSPHPTNAAIVVEIFERVAAGETCNAIAFDLHTRGVVRLREGHWNRERIWAIVHATTYLGEWVADKAKGLKVPVPQLVSQELFDRAHEALSRFGLRGLNRVKHHSLCQGISRCSRCGAAMGVTWSTNASTKVRTGYYVCTRRRAPRFGEERCMQPMRRVEEVDAAVWAKVVEILSTPNYLERALVGRADETDGEGKNWKNDLAQYRRALARSVKAEETILERFTRGLVSEAAMDAALKRSTTERKMLERQIATAEARVKGLERDRAELNALESGLDDLRRAMNDPNAATPEIRRSLAQKLVPGRGDHFIEIHDRKIRMHVIVSAPPPPSLGGPRSVATLDSALTSFARRSASCSAIRRRPPAGTRSSSTRRCGSTSGASGSSSRAKTWSARACA